MLLDMRYIPMSAAWVGLHNGRISTFTYIYSSMDCEGIRSVRPIYWHLYYSIFFVRSGVKKMNLILGIIITAMILILVPELLLVPLLALVLIPIFLSLGFILLFSVMLPVGILLSL